MKKILKSIIAPVVFATTTVSNAQTVQLIADNDYALFAGTVSSIDRLIYNNSVVWNNQLVNASSINLNIGPGETYLYILAMGGGAFENVSGKFDGANIVNIFNSNNADIQVSNAIQSSLPSYNLVNVINGTYSVNLSDGQTAFGAVNTWNNPAIDGAQTVILANPAAEITPGGFRQGFTFGTQTAVFYRITAATIPEPSSVMLLGAGMMSLLVRRRR
jgi:PEP-CTERM motif